MEEIPNWQNLMEVYVKLYEEFKDLLEDGYEYTNPFEYGPNRFFDMVYIRRSYSRIN